MNVEDRPAIVQTVEELQRRWRGLLERAPPHLMKLEFRLDEAVFHHCIKDIEKELVYEEQVRTSIIIIALHLISVTVCTSIVKEQKPWQISFIIHF